MLGWSRAEAARASWMNLSLASGSACPLWRQEFQGYDALKLDIFGLVDDAHPAPADLLDNAVLFATTLLVRAGDSRFEVFVRDSADGPGSARMAAQLPQNRAVSGLLA